MNLDYLRRIWEWINELPSTTKTLIIFIMFVCMIPLGVRYVSHSTLEDYFEYQDDSKKKAEEYALWASPKISNEVFKIYASDDDIKNVVLISYHNNTESLNKLSYLYMKAITAEPGDDTWKTEWRDLEFIYYSTEVARIHRDKFLRVDSLNQMDMRYPKLKSKLEACGAKSASFYPIEGLTRPIGMVIVYYNKPKHFELGYYQKVLSDPMQQLSKLLDYENLNKYKD